MKIKKAKKVCVALFSMIFLLCACENKPETNYPEPKKNTPVSIAEKGLKIEPDKGLEIVKNTADFVEVKENQEYNFETDNQNIPHGLMHEDCLETEDSYYFLRCASIYTFDKTAKTYSWLCNKPDCSHFGSHTCNAFFPYDCEAMDYYEGNIYVLIRESSELAEEEKNEGLWKETLELYRMSLDGSSRTRVCTIATAIARKGMDDNVFSLRYAEIHRGYLYYIYTYGIGEGEDSFYANNSNTLYRIALDGKSEKECICTIEYGGLASGINPYFQGSYMYFIKADFNHEGTGYGDLYRLNTESMKLEYMDIKNVTNFIISGDEIIYIELEPGKYYSCNTKTWEKKVFFEPEPRGDLTYGYMLYDGKYYYFNLFNIDSMQYICEVYNEQLEKVGEYDRTSFKVLNNNNEQVYADYQPGKSDYDFMITYDGNILYYLDKSLLGTGEEKFVELRAE